MKKLLLLLSFAALTFFACEDDFNLNGEWEDITIVYGLINPNDTAHYIKINKAFLGDATAEEMAAQTDSLQYEKQLSVQLIEYKLNDLDDDYKDPENWTATGEVLDFYRTNEIPKRDTNFYGKPGIFGTQVNYLYKSTDRVRKGYKYILEIKIPGKEELITSETYVMNNFQVKIPRSNEVSSSQIRLADYDRPFQTTYYKAVYGKNYRIVLRFHYTEIEGTDTTYHYVDLDYPETVVQNMRKPNQFDLGYLELYENVGGEKFFSKVGRAIPDKPGVKRIAGNLDFIYHVGGEKLNVYISVSEAVIGFGREQPEYSNIKNGVGVFDSRSYTTVADKKISGLAIDSLAYGHYTKHLRFANVRGEWK